MEDTGNRTHFHLAVKTQNVSNSIAPVFSGITREIIFATYTNDEVAKKLIPEETEEIAKTQLRERGVSAVSFELVIWVDEPPLRFSRDWKEISELIATPPHKYMTVDKVLPEEVEVAEAIQEIVNKALVEKVEGIISDIEMKTLAYGVPGEADEEITISNHVTYYLNQNHKNVAAFLTVLDKYKDDVSQED